MTDTSNMGGCVLRTKAALVLGGSRGIGAAVALRLARDGCRVALSYRADKKAAEAVVSDVARNGGECLCVQGDIAEHGGAQNIVQEAVRHFGRIDILVISAGIASYRSLEAVDAAFIRRLFDVNVVGLILAVQAALPHLSSPGGRIINFASGLAFRPVPGSSVYAASKAAVVSLTHALAKELGPKGITVNAVAPGVIETDMTTEVLKQRGADILSLTPLGRIGQPGDIAGIVAFLASPEAGWITGRTILADGGLL